MWRRMLTEFCVEAVSVECESGRHEGVVKGCRRLSSCPNVDGDDILFAGGARTNVPLDVLIGGHSEIWETFLQAIAAGRRLHFSTPLHSMQA